MSDIILNSDFDIELKDGDFVLDKSTEQHLSLLLLSEKGEWREFPWLGVGIRNMLLDDAQPLLLKKEIRKQVQLDGAILTKLRLKQGEVELEADYS